MPVYDYKCEDCGTKQEVYMKTRKEEEDVKCEKCGSKNMKKLMSAACVSVGGSSYEPSSAPSCATGNCPFN